MNIFNLNSGFRIVYYHLVSNFTEKYHFSNISISNFVRQIKYFKKNFHIISLSEAIAKAKNNESLDGYMCITTDDGFSENYTVVAPILLKLNVTATFFVIENMLDNSDLMWRNKLLYIRNKFPNKLLNFSKKISDKFDYPYLSSTNNFFPWVDLYWNMDDCVEISNMYWSNCVDESLDSFLNRKKPYLTSQEIKQLLKLGFEIGSHTSNHLFLDRVSSEDLVREVFESCKRLSDKFSYNIDTISYPFGKRPLKKYEELLRSSQLLTCMLGINSTFSNTLDPYCWDRDKMEYNSFFWSWLNFNFRPYYNRLRI